MSEQEPNYNQQVKKNEIIFIESVVEKLDDVSLLILDKKLQERVTQAKERLKNSDAKNITVLLDNVSCAKINISQECKQEDKLVGNLTKILKEIDPNKLPTKLEIDESKLDFVDEISKDPLKYKTKVAGKAIPKKITVTIKKLELDHA